MKVKFLVTPVGLMMGNIESARRLKKALLKKGIDVSDELTANEYDILHVHTPVPFGNITEVKKAKKKGIPVVMHAHTTAEDSKNTWTGSTALSSIIGGYLTMFYNLGDLVIAPSAWTKSTLQNRGIIAPIKVLSNGIEIDRFKFDRRRREKFRNKYGISDDDMVVYLIGVLCVKKGVETLPPVAAGCPDLQFVWVGRRYPLYCPFKVSGAIARSPDNVKYLHDVEDILDAHCGCDIFFNPSFAENQGMAVLEGLAVGRPVVARNLPVYEGLLKNGRNALLGNTVDDFIKAIKLLKSDVKLRNEFIKNGEMILTDHDMSKIADELMTFYESLLNGKQLK